MITHLHTLRLRAALGALAVLALAGAPSLRAQEGGAGLELHVNENVSASSLGLPHFPTSHPFHGASKDSAADVGFSFGKVHFRVMASHYETYATADQVLDFYRKPLARFGEVLECEHGQPVGPLKSTKQGLTCADSHGPHSHVTSDADSPRQLRSGTPEQYRVVAIETHKSSATNFTLIYLDLPKDDDAR
jgi:hypothetical protein